MIDWWQGIQFQQPVWILLIPVSLIVLAYVVFRHQWSLRNLLSLVEFHRRQRYRHPFASEIQQIAVARQSLQGKTRQFVNFLLLGIIVCCFQLSLAQPYRLGKQLPEPPQYRDVIFIVDTSVSMVLRDYLVEGQRVDRLTMLKSVLNHFVNQLQGNRIGVIVFSEQSHTLVPLTTDANLLQSMIKRLELTLTGRRSDVGKAILYGVTEAQKQSQHAEKYKPVLVLITDVNRPVRKIDPRTSAGYAASLGYQLHTIAIGAGSYQAEERDVSTLIYEPVNFELLEAIAKQGNGRAFRARDTQSLSSAISTIQESAKRETLAEPRFIVLPLYQWPLFTGMLLLALSHLLFPIYRSVR